MQDALNGSVDAYNTLLKNAQKDIALQGIHIDTEASAENFLNEL